jgi:hypothetical protein
MFGIGDRARLTHEPNFRDGISNSDAVNGLISPEWAPTEQSQQATNAHLAHFAQRDFLRAGPQPD